MTDLEPRYMEETSGGEVKKQIIKYRLVMFNCTCKHTIENPNIMGYIHKGGHKDATGQGWWLFVRCPKCKYDWALHKIDRRVRMMDKETLPNFLNKFYNDMKKGDMLMRKNREAPTPCTLYLLHLPMSIDVVPVEGFAGRSPMDLVKPILAKTNPDAYVCIAEGWFRRLTDSERKDWRKAASKQQYGDIQKDEKRRKECLIVNGANRDSSWKKYEFFYIARGADGKITDFVEDNQEPSLHSDKLPGLPSMDDKPDFKKKEVK